MANEQKCPSNEICRTAPHAERFLIIFSQDPNKNEHYFEEDCSTKPKANSEMSQVHKRDHKKDPG